MIWQDVVLMIANLIFFVSLLAQVRYGHRKKKGLIKLTTSIPTALGIYAICIVYYSLELYLSLVMSILTAGLWTLISYQRILYKKP